MGEKAFNLKYNRLDQRPEKKIQSSIEPGQIRILWNVYVLICIFALVSSSEIVLFYTGLIHHALLCSHLEA